MVRIVSLVLTLLAFAGAAIAQEASAQPNLFETAVRVDKHHPTAQEWLAKAKNALR